MILNPMRKGIKYKTTTTNTFLKKKGEQKLNMALSSEMSAADIAAVTGATRNDGFGFGGDGSIWIIILFLFCFMGNGWGGNGYGGAGGVLPWAYAQNTDNLVQSGFNQAATSAALGDLSNAITTGFAGAEVSRCAQMSNLTSQINALGTAQLTAGYQNQLATAQLGSDIAREACASRTTVSDGIRDVLASVQNQTQTILDVMAQNKIDEKNEKILELQNQLNMATLRESQNAQTAQILANNEAQTTALEAYLSPVPRPCYVVSNPNCCGYGYGGCGGYVA